MVWPMNLKPRPCRTCGVIFQRIRKVQPFCSLACHFRFKLPKGLAEDECWEWTGTFNSGGYGIVSDNHRTLLAHRVSLEVGRGEPLGELRALHHCDNTRCVNPVHLYAGTDLDNVRDRVTRGRSRYVLPNLRGEAAPAAKATEAQVMEMRALHDAGGKIAHIARGYPHLSEDGVRRIVKRRNWRHLP